MYDVQFAGFGDVPTPEMVEMVKAAAATPEGYGRLAKALNTPLSEAVLKGDITQDIFVSEYFPPGVDVEYPLDFINAGEDKEFSAFAIPSAGAIPHRIVEGDMVKVSLAEYGSSIDTNKKYIRDGRWNIVDRMMEVLVNSHVVLNNRNCWRTLLAAATNRGIAVYDSEATAGYFTKRLVSLLKTAMTRYGGGNTASNTGFRLTDLYLSIESMEDIRNWDITQVDDVTRRQIFLGDDNSLTTIYGVTLHPLMEFGVNQEWDKYYTGTLGGSFSGSKTELVFGIDRTKRAKSFVRPWRQKPQITEDDTVRRQRRFSLWSYEETGYAVCDSRPVLIGQV